MDGAMLGDDALREKASAIYATLVEHYGAPEFTPGDDPVDELIATILSANTNDANSGRAFAQLQEAFGGDWEAVRTAPLDVIKAAIRPAGMYNQKAPAIVATLERLKADWGGYDLHGLAQMSVAEARAYLASLPGVGFKTASIVLLFCFNQAAFPVDTHIQRISQRTGVSPRRANPDKIMRIWESLLPPSVYYPLHINLIRHGRQVCQAQTPRCELCPLQSRCDYAQRVGDWRNW